MHHGNRLLIYYYLENISIPKSIYFFSSKFLSASIFVNLLFKQTLLCILLLHDFPNNRLLQTLICLHHSNLQFLNLFLVLLLYYQCSVLITLFAFFRFYPTFLMSHHLKRIKISPLISSTIPIFHWSIYYFGPNGHSSIL